MAAANVKTQFSIAERPYFNLTFSNRAAAKICSGCTD